MKKGLSKIKKDCLEQILRLHMKAQSGHIGSSLSCLDILVYLFFSQMKPVDKFILSKGHAAASLYTVLAKAGYITKKLLDTYYQDGTYLAAHPPCSGKVPGIIFGTGSLGHGLSLATGLALATKYSKKKYLVYCVISEGDCDGGSTWEAALFAAHHQLNNLIIIVDHNKLQAFGRSEDVLSLVTLKAKFRAFNFEVFEAKDGNELRCIDETFKKMSLSKSKQPKVIIAHTVKGSGVSFMENKLEWHYLPMNDKQYQQAMKEVGEKNA